MLRNVNKIVVKRFRAIASPPSRPLGGPKVARLDRKLIVFRSSLIFMDPVFGTAIKLKPPDAMELKTRSNLVDME